MGLKACLVTVSARFYEVKPLRSAGAVFAGRLYQMKDQ